MTQPRKVEDIMTRDVKTAKTEDTVLRVADVMNKYEIGCVIVTENEKPVGILTERDILKRVVLKRKDPVETAVGEVMSKPLVTVRPQTPVSRAARKMIKSKIKKLIVTHYNSLLGILSLTDLVPLLETENMIDSLPLKDAPKSVRKVFEIYTDPIRQIRKKCPLTLMGGASISCIGPKCMWYINERCAMLGSVEK